VCPTLLTVAVVGGVACAVMCRQHEQETNVGVFVDKRKRALTAPTPGIMFSIPLRP
jgi:hypothetical protein